VVGWKSPGEKFFRGRGTRLKRTQTIPESFVQNFKEVIKGREGKKLAKLQLERKSMPNA